MICKKCSKLITSFFMLALMLSVIALFIPLFSIVEAGEVVERRFIFNWIFSDYRGANEYLTRWNSLDLLIGVVNLVVTLAVIASASIGIYFGIKSFKDDNEKIGRYLVIATMALSVSYFFARMQLDIVNITIFLPITLIIGMITLISKIVINLVVNIKEITLVELIAFVLNKAAVVLVVVLSLILFGSFFEALIDFDLTAMGLGPMHYLNGNVGGLALLREAELLYAIIDAMGNPQFTPILSELNSILSDINLLANVLFSVVIIVAVLLTILFIRLMNFNKSRCKFNPLFVLPVFVLFLVMNHFFRVNETTSQPVLEISVVSIRCMHITVLVLSIIGIVLSTTSLFLSFVRGTKA